MESVGGVEIRIYSFVCKTKDKKRENEHKTKKKKKKKRERIEIIKGDENERT